jgi:hypothetical protein
MMKNKIHDESHDSFLSLIPNFTNIKDLKNSSSFFNKRMLEDSEVEYQKQ